jgi:hypothetical protein
MEKAGVFSYKYRIIYSLIGFFLLYLMTPPVLLLQSVGAYSLSSLIITILLAPAYPLPEEGPLVVLLVMFFWGSAYPLPEEGPLVVLLVMFFWGSVGFYLGFVKDRFNVSKVKRIKQFDRNVQMTNPYIDKIIKNPENKSKKRGYTLRDWIILISTILCASFIILIVNFPEIIWFVERPRGCSWCGETETDAQNTLAALASYFSEPEHTEAPTVQELVHTHYRV